MGNWKRLVTQALVVVAVLGVVSLGVGIGMTHFLVDLWWFESLDLAPYFWLRVLYRYLLSGGVTLLFFLIFVLNFWAASRYLGVDERALESMERPSANYYRGVLALFQAGSAKVYLVVSLILAVLVALPFYKEWEMALLYLIGPDSGVTDPVFKNDISYYLFGLPFDRLIQSELLTAFGLLFSFVAILYFIENEIIPDETRQWPTGAKVHLSILGFVTVLVTAWGLVLHRHHLLFTDTHEPVYFGPGFVEMFYHLPLVWLAIVALIGMGVSGVVFVHTRKALNFCLMFAALVALSLGLHKIQGIPDLLDRFVVKPNPVKAEAWAMRNNIEATLSAFGLNHFRTVDFRMESDSTAKIDDDLRRHLYNIPIWDHEYLDDVYQQLQGIRPYYQFSGVDVGRYEVKGRIEQVNIAARELNIASLPPEAQNWENRHLRYTHGYGVVITPTAQDGEQPMEWYLRDLTLQSGVGFRIANPDIYFGTEQLDYAIVPNRANVVEVSSGDEASNLNYSGLGGVRVATPFHRLLFALYFQDKNLFFSQSIDSKSQVLFRRNIVERIKTIAPFLALDGDPYVVAAPQRIYWVVDAYTLSEYYPVSQPTSFQFGGEEAPRTFNYIRNSVKVVVDAFEGKVDFYIYDPDDPVVNAYSRVYPGIFKQISVMPPTLLSQLRYPKDVFSVQLQLYAKYHQTDPALFFQQAETWDFAQVANNRVKPYYVTASLDGCEGRQEFLLINPMSPIGRTNLSALALARGAGMGACGSANNVTIYKFPREIQVEGPGQISAWIDQDPEISKLFSLWDQKGSHVIRGRIIILPINNGLLYVQPVYLISSTTTKIPQLVRVILSLDNSVAMDTTLSRALDQLNAKLLARRGNTIRLPTSMDEEPAAQPASPPAEMRRF